MKQIPGTIITKLKNKASNFMQDILLFFRMKHPEDKTSLAQSGCKKDQNWIAMNLLTATDKEENLQK